MQWENRVQRFGPPAVPHKPSGLEQHTFAILKVTPTSRPAGCLRALLEVLGGCVGSLRLCGVRSWSCGAEIPVTQLAPQALVPAPFLRLQSQRQQVQSLSPASHSSFMSV